MSNSSGIKKVEVMKEVYEKVKKKKIDEKCKTVVELVDQVSGDIEEFLKPVLEKVEEIEGVLRKVHEPPSLVDLAAGPVVEEGVEVEGLPSTFKTKVIGVPS